MKASGSRHLCGLRRGRLKETYFESISKLYPFHSFSRGPKAQVDPALPTLQGPISVSRMPVLKILGTGCGSYAAACLSAPFCFKAFLEGFRASAMVKGAPKRTSAKRAMPFPHTPRSQRTSWKQRQQSWIMQGLKAMKAPWVGTPIEVTVEMIHRH